MLGDQALDRLLEHKFDTVLDIGSGGGQAAERLRAAGKRVTTLDRDPAAGADFALDYMEFGGSFDAVWCCHVLEHQRNPGAFLDKLAWDLGPGGALALTVPPLKTALVGGHVSLWTPGLLLYHLVLAGFDCRAARVGSYGYNVSVLLAPVARWDVPAMKMARGDLEDLAERFPPALAIGQGAPGQCGNIGW